MYYITKNARKSIFISSFRMYVHEDLPQPFLYDFARGLIENPYLEQLEIKILSSRLQYKASLTKYIDSRNHFIVMLARLGVGSTILKYETVCLGTLSL